MPISSERERRSKPGKSNGIVGLIVAGQDVKALDSDKIASC